MIHFVDRNGADTVLNFSSGVELKLQEIYYGSVSDGKTVSYTFTEIWNHVLLIGTTGASGTGIQYNFSCSCNYTLIRDGGFGYPPAVKYKVYLLSNVNINDKVTLRGYTGNKAFIHLYGID